MVELTVAEHAEAHRLLWLQHGRMADYWAWQGLAQILPREEVLSQVMRDAGRRGGQRPKDLEAQRRNGSKLWATPEMCAHISEKRREQSRIGKNPMQGKKQARVSCLCCRKNYPVNGLKNHQKVAGFSVAK